MAEAEQGHYSDLTTHELASSTEDLFNRISTGETTDPKALNDYLDLQIQGLRKYASEQAKPSDPDLLAVEHSNEQIMRYIKARNGSYQNEKAEFCLQEAQEWMEGAKLNERLARQHDIVEQRSYAANWLRMAAACLEMPEETKSAQA